MYLKEPKVGQEPNIPWTLGNSIFFFYYILAFDMYHRWKIFFCDSITLDLSSKWLILTCTS